MGPNIDCANYVMGDNCCIYLRASKLSKMSLYYFLWKWFVVCNFRKTGLVILYAWELITLVRCGHTKDFSTFLNEHPVDPCTVTPALPYAYQRFLTRDFKQKHPINPSRFAALVHNLHLFLMLFYRTKSNHLPTLNRNKQTDSDNWYRAFDSLTLKKV